MTRPMRWRAFLFACSIVAAANPWRPVLAQPQVANAGAFRTRARDSAATIRKARSLQAGFESRRRQLLPRFYSGTANQCVTIGRFCYWSSGTSNEDIPEEGNDIRRARMRLLRELERLAIAAPSDDWIVGQRVRYLVEARDTSALRVARDCAATRWWCDALTGYALHVNGDFAGADDSFARALGGMPTAVRCDWTNIWQLLDSEPRKEYRRLPCDEREARMDRIWWLADPLLMTPGNERRTEHYSRMVYATLQKNAANTHGLSWGKDLTELVVRFGWSEKWTQKSQSSPYGVERPPVSGHDREPAYHFLPARRAPENLELIADSLWDMDRDPPLEQYAPAYARAFTELNVQVARFRRGDSTVVVAAYDVSEDTLFRGRRLNAALVAADKEAALPAVHQIDSASLTQVLTLTTAWRSQLVGVELLTSDSAAAGRWRSGYGSIPLETERLTVSDLLFVDVGDGLPDDLAGAVPRTHGGTVFSRNAKVGLFWEIYGKAPVDSAVPISLTITPLDAGFLRTALRALRIAAKPTPLNIRWQENGAGGVFSARSVQLDLSLVPPGRYEVELEVGAVRAAKSSRIITIR